ncbi:hypothetical protein RCL1_004624 [Eukaryota sp. TZLM3-RCL]
MSLLSRVFVLSIQYENLIAILKRADSEYGADFQESFPQLSTFKLTSHGSLPEVIDFVQRTSFVALNSFALRLSGVATTPLLRFNSSLRSLYSLSIIIRTPQISIDFQNLTNLKYLCLETFHSNVELRSTTCLNNVQSLHLSGDVDLVSQLPDMKLTSLHFFPSTSTQINNIGRFSSTLRHLELGLLTEKTRGLIEQHKFKLHSLTSSTLIEHLSLENFDNLKSLEIIGPKEVDLKSNSLLEVAKLNFHEGTDSSVILPYTTTALHKLVLNSWPKSPTIINQESLCCVLHFSIVVDILESLSLIQQSIVLSNLRYFEVISSNQNGIDQKAISIPHLPALRTLVLVGVNCLESAATPRLKHLEFRTKPSAELVTILPSCVLPSLETLVVIDVGHLIVDMPLTFPQLKKLFLSDSVFCSKIMSEYGQFQSRNKYRLCHLCITNHGSYDDFEQLYEILLKFPFPDLVTIFGLLVSPRFLGDVFFEGYSDRLGITEVDQERSFQFYKKAEEAQDKLAYMRLAKAYKHGYGVNRDELMYQFYQELSGVFQSELP